MNKRNIITKYNYKFCRLFTLLFIVHLYYIFGAVAFVYLEECDHENSLKTLKGCRGHEYDVLNRTCMEHVRLLCTELSDERSQNKCYAKITATCSGILQNGSTHSIKNTVEACSKWGLKTIIKWNVFCMVILYTIGYGNVAPKTDAGKIFTIFYAIVGVPLSLAFLTSTAETFIAILMSCNEKIQLNLLKRKTVRHSNTGLALTLIIFVLGVILAGAAIATHEKMENLRFLDAVYFWLITVSTIGLGDIYYEPKHFSGKEMLYDVPVYVLVVLGLAMLASTISSLSTCIQEKTAMKIARVRKHHHKEQDVNET